jgi:hypothetical protein
LNSGAAETNNNPAQAKKAKNLVFSLEASINDGTTQKAVAAKAN